MCDSTYGDMAKLSESGEVSKLRATLEEKMSVISRQSQELSDLKSELKSVLSERDMLLCEVSRLKFEMEMSELKRLHVGSTVVSSISQQSHMNGQCSDHSRESSPHKAERPGPPTPNYNNWAIAKKGSVRNNGEVLKRSRIQTAYELSQDLQDKRIEMLERKYGGVKARMAALTIQRAFRRYTLRRKFAAITAMAKAEKRLSRRLQKDGELCQPDGHPSPTAGSPGAPGTPGPMVVNGNVPVVHAGRPIGPMPIRSLSMRERRNVDYVPHVLPRSQSGCCEQYDYYPQPCAPCVSCPQHDSSVTYWDSTTSHYYSPHESYSEHDMNSSMGSVCPEPSMRRSLAPLMNHSHHQLIGHPGYPGGQPGGHPGGHPVHVQQPLPPPPQQYDSCNAWPNPAGQGPGSDYSNSPSSSPAGSVASYQMRPLHQQHQNRKVPPDVPKRTSSITPGQGRGSLSGRLQAGGDSGSLTSVQSSGSISSDSSTHTATASVGCDHRCEETRPGSPLWKRKGQEGCQEGCLAECGSQSQGATVNHHQQMNNHQETQHVLYKVSETVRKRQYRVGLNLFNKKPERGISYLIRRGFLENSPQGVARFLISRKGLSKQMIGEYLGNLQSPFNMAVLECFADELDLCGMAVDVGLRKFQSHFRMPGEAQKIERLMEVFSTRYCRCNQDVVARLRSPDTVFVLAFAIIMLNTDLHTPNIKPERRMKLDDFVKNLRGIDDCHDIDRDMLAGIYDRVKSNEFKPGSDHVTQVMKVQSTIVGKKPNMALPHRRLVCYCRLYEVPDPHKKERPGVHQREVFLFNDLLVITKILSKKKNSVTYTFRQSFPLCGMVVNLFEVPYYQFIIQLSQRVDGKVLITFNARNEHDRCKFAEDLRESVCEMDEMENLRIEAELERQKSNHSVRAARTSAAGSAGGSVGNSSDNRDSGVADVEGVYACGAQDACGRGEADPCSVDRDRLVSTEMALKRSALSNSLLDIHEQFAGEKPQRRGSVGSLDSGMSISFQSTSASTVSRDSSPQNVQPSPGAVVKGANKVPCHLQNHAIAHPGHPVHPNHTGQPGHPGQPSFLGGLFNKRERKSLRPDENSPFSRSTEV